MELFRPGLLVACFLLCTGLAQNCEYDPPDGKNLSLDFVSAPGRVIIEVDEDVSDPKSCQKRCCDAPECDVALMQYPMDTKPQCMLINCHINGRDECVYQQSTQFKLYRKKGTAESHGENGKELRVVPMMGSVEPRSSERNESNNGKLSTRAASDGFET